MRLRKPNRLRRPKLVKSRKEKRTEYPRFHWKRPSRRYEGEQELLELQEQEPED